MKKLLIAIAATLAFSAAAYACTMITIINQDGSMTICQQCCDSNGNCQLICF